MLRKFLLSFLASLVVLFSFAPFFMASPVLASCTPTVTGPCATGSLCQNVSGNFCCTGGGGTLAATECQTTTTNSSTQTTTSTTPTTSWYNQGPVDFYQKVFDKANPSEIFGERYTYAQVTWIGYSLVGLLVGGNLDEIIAAVKQIQENPQQGLNLLSDPKSKIAQIPDPMMGAISQFYMSPPASGVYWLSQEVNKFKIVKTAYAASSNGFGFNSLQIFLPLWTASRNFAYTIMIIITLILAFAIMFRVRLNPQVAITVQNVIPQLAVTLILITFSYAIAGFLIDLMYLVFGIIVYGFNQFGGLSGLGLDPKDLFSNFVNGSIFNMITTTSGVGGTVTLVVVIVALLLLMLTVVMIPFSLGLLIAIFMFFIKTFIMLAQVYLSLIINIVFAPIVLLAEAIPFVKASAMGWFRSIIADLLVFLAVGILFLVDSLLNATLSNSTLQGWGPPYVGFSTFWLKIFIWIGVWSILPNIKDIVYQMMEKKGANIQTPREFAGAGENFFKGLQSLSKKGGNG